MGDNNNCTVGMVFNSLCDSRRDFFCDGKGVTYDTVKGCLPVLQAQRFGRGGDQVPIILKEERHYNVEIPILTTDTAQIVEWHDCYPGRTFGNFLAYSVFGDSNEKMARKCIDAWNKVNHSQLVMTIVPRYFFADAARVERKK